MRSPVLGRRRQLAVVAVITASIAGLVVAAGPWAAGSERASATPASSHSLRPTYLDVEASPEARAKDLVERMSLHEQIGQMVQIQVGRLRGDCQGANGPLNDACMKKVLVDDAVGSILSGGGDAPVDNTPAGWAQQIDAIVKYSVEHSRLHIPVIYGSDVVHGHNNVLGATLFPQQIGLGATFDPQLITAVARSASAATRATGVRWAFAPVADVDQDTRWGRYYEPFGEDPLLTGTLAAAAVRGFQDGGSVAATVKHFAGYGAPSNGHDRVPADMSMRTLADVQLPSYKAAIDAGALSVMVNSGAVNGVPVHASHYLLTQVLRDEWHFSGVVISDWADVANLVTAYHVAPDYEHAVAMAVNAGVDVTMEPYDADRFTSELAKAVDDGLVTTERVREAAYRVVLLKFRVGAFDHPYADASSADHAVLGADRALARDAADKSMVLLRNERGVLPLGRHARVVLTGPSADSVANQLGGWSVGWQGVPAGVDEPAVTVLDGLRHALSSTLDFEPYQDAAVAAARSADAVVVVVGNPPGAESPNDKEVPELPADQQALIASLNATGTPVVVVLIDDRPLVLGPAASAADGLVMAWRPGTEGGDAVADVLLGAVNPSGRLPVSWPKTVGDQPMTYRQLPGTNTGPSSVYDPLFPFGFGLSYTTFATTAVQASVSGDAVDVAVTVGNTGSRAGDLVVPVYVAQPTSVVLVPPRRLVGFTRVHLDAGASATVHVAVPLSVLAVTPGDVDAAGARTFEHGEYVFFSGPVLGGGVSASPVTL